MPNWVYNTVTVSGDDMTLELFRQRVSKPYILDGNEVNENFSFWNIVHPEENQIEQYVNELDGSMPFWYKWNLENWGTKWDAGHVEMEENENNIVYRFETAWSAPDVLINTLTSQYPDLQFTMHYVEEQGWGGEFTVKGGETIESKLWDIPSSHKEYTDLGMSCFCEYDDEEFADCPAK